MAIARAIPTISDMAMCLPLHNELSLKLHINIPVSNVEPTAGGHSWKSKFCESISVHTHTVVMHGRHVVFLLCGIGI